MLFRYRARNYPETLDTQEQARWLEHCRARLVDGESGHFTFAAFRAEIEQLRQETAEDDAGIRLLDDVAAFGAELESFVRQNA
jgi:exodeoxyribonuclease-1